jgi:tetratricopeptide (TPR) repeat protein
MENPEDEVYTEELLSYEPQAVSASVTESQKPEENHQQEEYQQIESEFQSEGEDYLQPADSPTNSATVVTGKYAGATVEWVEELVARKLTSIATADHYGVLGVERIATTRAISVAYKEMRETFDSFRDRWPENKDLNQALDDLFGKIEAAYMTLSDSEKRSEYDRPPGAAFRSTVARRNRTSRQAPRLQPESRVQVIPEPIVEPLRKVEPSVRRVPEAALIKKEPNYDPISLAAENYRRGRGRFDRNDFHGAVHFFREAAKLDPSKSHHHYYLGVTLSVLAQARHDRHPHSHDKGCHVNCMLGGGLARNPRLRHEAEKHMLKAAELDRTNPEIRLRLARLYREAGMEKKADHYLLETLMLDAGNATALRELGIGVQRAAL